MSEKVKSIFDDVEHIYAENLKGRRVPLTIKHVILGVDFFDPNGRKSTGFDLVFEETTKKFGIVGVTVRRQLAMATGTENPEEMKGKKIMLYPVESKKSATGQAIRIAKAGL